MLWNTVAFPALHGSLYLGYLCYITAYSMINMSPSDVGIALLFLDTLKNVLLYPMVIVFLIAQHLVGLAAQMLGFASYRRGSVYFPLTQCFLPAFFAPAALVASGNFSEKQILGLPNPDLLNQKLWAQPCVL